MTDMMISIDRVLEEGMVLASEGACILEECFWELAFWGLDAAYALLGAWDRVAIKVPGLARKAWSFILGFLAVAVPALLAMAAWAARKALPYVTDAVMAAAGWVLVGILAVVAASKVAAQAMASGWAWRAELIAECA